MTLSDLRIISRTTEESTTVPASSDRSPARRPRLAAGDVIALVYLVICAALLVWAFVVSAGDDSGESMAGVIPLLATAPASLVLLMLPGAPW